VKEKIISGVGDWVRTEVWTNSLKQRLSDTFGKENKTEHIIINNNNYNKKKTSLFVVPVLISEPCHTTESDSKAFEFRASPLCLPYQVFSMQTGWFFIMLITFPLHSGSKLVFLSSLVKLYFLFNLLFTELLVGCFWIWSWDLFGAKVFLIFPNIFFCIAN